MIKVSLMNSREKIPIIAVLYYSKTPDGTTINFPKSPLDPCHGPGDRREGQGLPQLPLDLRALQPPTGPTATCLAVRVEGTPSVTIRNQRELIKVLEDITLRDFKLQRPNININ